MKTLNIKGMGLKWPVLSQEQEIPITIDFLEKDIKLHSKGNELSSASPGSGMKISRTKFIPSTSEKKRKTFFKENNESFFLKVLDESTIAFTNNHDVMNTRQERAGVITLFRPKFENMVTDSKG